jgi:hypothetical protein
LPQAKGLPHEDGPSSNLRRELRRGIWSCPKVSARTGAITSTNGHADYGPVHIRLDKQSDWISSMAWTKADFDAACIKVNAEPNKK